MLQPGPQLERIKAVHFLQKCLELLCHNPFDQLLAPKKEYWGPAYNYSTHRLPDLIFLGWAILWLPPPTGKHTNLLQL